MSGKAFSNITTAGFKGLSLDEIMAIPLAKQARQDASLAATDELEALESKRLEGDKGVVDAELERFRKEAADISKQLMERGVDRNLSNKLRKLRSDKKRAFGASGVVGQAQANYDAAQKYINDLATEKVQQAGWSPMEAKAWATSQVKDFGSSFDKLGNFKQFQGKGLATKVDSNDWINKNLKLVAADTNQELMKYAGNLDQFNKAYASGIVTDKDFEKIMTSLTTMAANDPSLQASLAQQQFFDPNSGDPRNIGTWEFRTREDGSKKKVFVPGNQFGRQLYGAAFGAQTHDQSYKFHFEDDFAAKKLFEAGLDAEEANDMVRAANGVLNTITPDNIETIMENADLALQEIENEEAVMKATWTPEMIEANPKVYAQAQKDLNDAKVKYFNLQSRIEGIQKESLKDMTPHQQKSVELYNKVSKEIPDYYRASSTEDGITALENAIRQLPGGDKVIPEGGLSQIGVGSENMEAFLMSKYLEMKGVAVDKSSIANRSIFNWWGDEDLRYDPDIMDSMIDAKKALRNTTKKYLEQNPYSESYTEFGAMNAGKYSGKIGGINKMLSEGFQGAGYSDAYTGADINSYVTENYPPDDDGKKTVDYEIRVTDGIGPDGYPIEHLVVKDKGGSVLEVKAVTRGESGMKEYRDTAVELLKSSDTGLRTKGQQMLANHEFMPTIKKSLIRSGANKGRFTGEYSEVDNKPVEWIKDEIGGRTIWKIKVGDFTSEALGGEAEMASYLANQLFKDLENYDAGE